MTDEPKLLTWKVVPNHSRNPLSTILIADSMDFRHRYYLDVGVNDGEFELYCDKKDHVNNSPSAPILYIGFIQDCFSVAWKYEVAVRETLRERMQS
jgi:hypothetical protein